MRIGIDPGITGAIAFMDDAGECGDVMDIPTMAKASGKGQQIDPYALFSMLMELRRMSPCGATAYLERVNAMPGQGVSSVFSFGKSVGIIEGVIAALSIPVKMPTPQSWKKRAGLTGKDKDAARTLAIQLHPEIADKLSRKKDIGRADAILIAEFGE